MKKLAVFIILLLGFACEDGVEKPERLLSEGEMENIIYDLWILQTMSSTNPVQIQQNHVDVNKYIYNKYKIDSITFVQNQKYYASDIEKYQQIHKKVSERLKTEKAVFDSLVKKDVKTGRKKERVLQTTAPRTEQIE